MQTPGVLDFLQMCLLSFPFLVAAYYATPMRKRALGFSKSARERLNCPQEWCKVEEETTTAVSSRVESRDSDVESSNSNQPVESVLLSAIPE